MRPESSITVDFEVNTVNIKTSVVNHIGDRAVAAWIPIGVEFERRFAEGLSDHPLNVCEREGNAVLRLLGKVNQKRLERFAVHAGGEGKHALHDRAMHNQAVVPSVAFCIPLLVQNWRRCPHVNTPFLYDGSILQYKPYRTTTIIASFVTIRSKAVTNTGNRFDVTRIRYVWFNALS